MERRILVVDDDPMMLRLLTKHLRGANFEVLTADNGAEAMHLMMAEGPPLVISDWSMPGMSGLDLCKAIRKTEGIGFVYLIILTAHAEKERVVEALNAGANDFLAKPFHRGELLARVGAGMRIVTLEADLARRTRELYKANAELAVLNLKLNKVATTDELTDLPNRREGLKRLRNFWEASLDEGGPLSCIMVDIDHFKRCNDTFGHEGGDRILREVARTMEGACRRKESVCRLGGEEFLILCPGQTLQEAAATAETIRRAVQDHAIQLDTGETRATISLGVAERNERTAIADDMLRLADEAMYAAKRAGRNRIQVAASQQGTPAGAVAASSLA